MLIKSRNTLAYKVVLHNFMFLTFSCCTETLVHRIYHGAVKDKGTLPYFSDCVTAGWTSVTVRANHNHFYWTREQKGQLQVFNNSLKSAQKASGIIIYLCVFVRNGPVVFCARTWILFNIFKKHVVFEQVKLNIQFIYLACISGQNGILVLWSKSKIFYGKHCHCSMMDHDNKLNRIDDMIIVTETSRFTLLVSWDCNQIIT